MKQGHIKLARKVFSDPLWREPRVFSEFEAWIDLIQLAAWKDTIVTSRGVRAEVPRGHFLASVRLLAGRWQWGNGRVSRFLRRLQTDGRLRLTSGTGVESGVSTPNGTGIGTVYRIVNYELYQRSGTPNGTQNGTATERRRNKKNAVKQLSSTTKPSLAASAASGSETPNVTWLTPISQTWEQQFGAGSFPWGMAGRSLKPLRDHHPPDEIARHLARYLAETAPDFVNLHKFAQTFGSWAPKPITDEWGVLTEHGRKLVGMRP